MAASPLVSIIVPCYNSQTYLHEALGSALGQTYRHVEVIAVDDGSTNETPAVLQDYAQRFPAFRWVRNEVNRGLQASRNTGYRLARGEYILWLDDDDYLAPDFVESLAAHIPGSQASIIAGPWYKLRPVGRTWKRDAQPIVNTSSAEVLRRMMRGGWPQHCMACLFPRAAMEEAGLWDESLTMHEDRLLLTRLLLRDIPVVWTTESYAVYRLRGGSISTRRSEAVARTTLVTARLIAQELYATGRMERYANDFAHFIDLYYIDSLLRFPALAEQLLALRHEVCPRYRDLRALHSRVVRAALGDRLFARLAQMMGTAEQR